MTSEERKGYRILLTTLEISKTMTRRPDWECFNQVVRFLADYARVHPMPKEDHPVADRLISLAQPLLEAWYDEPYDYLGQLFSEKKCAIDEMGQVITPPSIVSYINDSAIGKVEEVQEEIEKRWKLVLDPCASTGRCLLDLAWRHSDRKLALFGVELDLDLVDGFPKEVLIERREHLLTAIEALKRERTVLAAQLDAQVISDKQLQTIEELAREVVGGLTVADADFVAQRRLIEELDVRATLAVESGEKVIYVQCMLGAASLLVLSTTSRHCGHGNAHTLQAA